MKNWKLAMELAGALIALVPASIAAQNSPVTSASELIGCWERIDFSEEAKKKINEIEPWPARYQWYCFGSDGVLQSLHSSYTQTISSSDLKEAFAQLKDRSEFTWKLLPNSFIQTTSKNGKENIFWASGFMGASYSFDQKVIKKGTLIMSIYDQEKNRPVYYRYLKRVQ